MSLTTNNPPYLYVFEDNEIRIVCPIIERYFNGHIDIATSIGLPGFVGTGDSIRFSSEWIRFVRGKGYVCGYIGLNPIFNRPSYYDDRDVFSDNISYIIDLTMSTDKIMSLMDGHRRRKISALGTRGIEYVTDKDAMENFLVDRLSPFMHEINALSYEIFVSQTLRFLDELTDVFLVGAGESEEIPAIHVFSYTRYAADSLFSISLPHGRKHTTALLWHGINYLKSKNIPILNLGAGALKYDSVAEYKRRFGARMVAMKRLKQIYDRSVYEELCRVTNVEPTDLTGYFPPYRIL